MNPESFFENFSLLAETPNGIQKLREMILQMAVQGKLVPQNPDDEPAEALLERIKFEMAAKNKKGRISSLFSENDNIPYVLPDRWSWTNLNQLGVLINGDRGKNYPSKKHYVDSGVPFVNAGHLVNGKISLENMNFITDEKYGSLRNGKLAEGDIIYCLRGTLGKCAIVSGIKTGAIASSLVIIRLSKEINRHYIYSFLISPFGKKLVKIFDNGTAQPNLSAKSVSNYPVPLPPLEEQKRIVAKVDQLMELCDQLESLQQKEHESCMHLNNAALNKMFEDGSPEEFAENWRLVCDNFGLLYDNLENVEKLRQAILQLAVMGKLVEQDEEDESADVLLEKIAAEKERLVKEGKIKKSKVLPSIEKDEIKFDVPDNWIWVRLGNSMIKITDGTHHSPTNGPTGDFKYISAKNIKNEGVSLTNVTYVTSEVHDEIYSRCNPEFGDILYIKDGATTGIVTINNLKEPFSLLSSVGLLKLPSQIDNRYLLHLLRSPYFYSMMRNDMTGVAITRVTLTKINNAIIPLPPLEEQKRIVARVDQLMELCDRLESGIRQAQEDGERLMEAVVNELLT